MDSYPSSSGTGNESSDEGRRGYYPPQAPVRVVDHKADIGSEQKVQSILKRRGLNKCANQRVWDLDRLTGAVRVDDPRGGEPTDAGDNEYACSNEARHV